MKILKYISFLSIITMFISCENFLTYQDKDKLIPSELSHYEELIYGELLRKEVKNTFYKLDLMTDDVADYVKDNTAASESDTRLGNKEWYIWSQDPQISSAGDEEVDECWESFYRKILMANVIEEKVAKFEDSPLKFRLLGEVQFIRAMSYYYLVNIYGTPYESFEQSKTALGVPINNETSIRQKSYQRETLRAVYDFMEKNLISAGENLAKGDGKKTKYRPNIDAVRLVLSRVYLYQKEYDKVISVTTDLISNGSTSIEPLANVKAGSDAGDFFFAANNTSIFFTWGDGGNSQLYNEYNKALKYEISPKLMSMFKSGDLRLSFHSRFGSNFPSKASPYSGTFFIKCYRMEEGYLNRAEAYAEKGNLASALKDINAIRKERFNNVPYELTSTDKAEVIQLVRDERRMELSFEDHRWFDIRRWGLEVVHTFKDRNDPTKFDSYKLKKGSPNYILPLPLTEQRLNDVITKFKREDCRVANI